MAKSVRYTLITLLIFISLYGSATRRVAVGSGNWASGGTWDPSGVPDCGDTVEIANGYTVDVNNQVNMTGCASPLVVYVHGVILFHKGTKLRFPCNSYVIVYADGHIYHDQGLANSNFIEICSIVEWNSNSNSDGFFCLPATAPYPGCATLPVELSSFSGELCGSNKMCLQWETKTEKNNDHYEVERSSDGNSFVKILSVNSSALTGNSDVPLLYSGVDENPLEGVNYYRLRQVDKDLTFTYSKVITMQMLTGSGLQFLIFPNSNPGEFTARINGLSESQNVSVLLRDASGTIVYKALHFTEGSSPQIKVSPGIRLPEGFYFCSFIINGTEHVVKIIVKNL